MSCATYSPCPPAFRQLQPERGGGHGRLHVPSAGGRRPGDPQGNPQAAQRRLLEKVDCGAVGPDGSLAVVASPAGWRTRGPVSINIYKPDGDPIRTLALEDQSVYARLALSTSAVYSTDQATLQVHPLDGGPVGVFSIPQNSGKQNWWTFFVSQDEHALWGWNAGTTEVSRFAIPDAK